MFRNVAYFRALGAALAAAPAAALAARGPFVSMSDALRVALQHRVSDDSHISRTKRARAAAHVFKRLDIVYMMYIQLGCSRTYTGHSPVRVPTALATLQSHRHTQDAAETTRGGALQVCFTRHLRRHAQPMRCMRLIRTLY